jgi:hypothetical protein
VYNHLLDDNLPS